MLKKINAWALLFLSYFFPNSERNVLKMLEIIGLEYREHGNYTEKATPRHLKKILSLALAWKKNQMLYQLDEDVRLSPAEMNSLTELEFYPRFLSTILRCPSLLEDLFVWILRDKNKAEVFVKFPEVTLQLIRSNLSPRIGRLGKEKLKIQETATPKQLTLLMEGREINILNPDQEVTFRNDYTLKIREIFRIFANKEIDGGNLEFMEEGVINWSPLHMGSWCPRHNKWDEVDLEGDFTTKLPVYRRLTQSEVEARYEKNLKAGEWVGAATATRGKKNLDFSVTHAYLEVAVPQACGDYNLYAFGKVAQEYPKNIFETLAMLCRLSHATIAYPDDNVFYTHREEGHVPFILTPQEGSELLRSIKNDIQCSREKNLLYQIESENCAKWVHTTLRSIIGKYSFPDLFWMPLLDAKSDSILGKIFAAICWLPKSIQVPFMGRAHVPFGAFQKTTIIENGKQVIKSLAQHEFCRHGFVFLPALMIQKLEQAKQRQMYTISALRALLFSKSEVGWPPITPLLSNERFAIEGSWLIYGIPIRSLGRSCRVMLSSA